MKKIEKKPRKVVELISRDRIVRDPKNVPITGGFSEPGKIDYPN